MDVESLLGQISTDTNIRVPKIYSKSVLSNDLKEKLLSYQEKHVLKLVSVLLKNNIALDASDTGTGKTYSSVAVCRELGKKPIIICPKTLIYNWISVLDYFGVEYYDIVNYETLKNGKTYATHKFKSRVTSPYVKIIEPDENDALKLIYKWTVPDDAIIIFDEAHRGKDIKTDNGMLIASTIHLVKNNIPVLLLSATICEKFTDIKILFLLLGFIPSTRNFNHYVKTLTNKYPQFRVSRKNYTNKNDYAIAKENMQTLMIYEEIKDFTSRIRIKDLGDQFPSNQWCAQQFVAEESDKISQAYGEISKLMEKLKKYPGGNHLAEIQKLKQEIELRKIPIFLEQAQLYLDDGKSVIIFVNYLDTLHMLSEQLDIRCQIHGSQTMEERKEAINKFQSNEERIIICQIRAGGVGISLHDLNGNHPRVTLINYPDSAADLIQALGRAPRSGAKSPVIQRIIFVANVDYEKKIMRNINRKLANISAINDGDLDTYKYKVNRVENKKIIEV